MSIRSLFYGPWWPWQCNGGNGGHLYDTDHRGYGGSDDNGVMVTMIDMVPMVTVHVRRSSYSVHGRHGSYNGNDSYGGHDSDGGKGRCGNYGDHGGCRK